MEKETSLIGEKVKCSCGVKKLKLIWFSSSQYIIYVVVKCLIKIVKHFF